MKNNLVSFCLFALHARLPVHLCAFMFVVCRSASVCMCVQPSLCARCGPSAMCWPRGWALARCGLDGHRKWEEPFSCSLLSGPPAPVPPPSSPSSSSPPSSAGAGGNHSHSLWWFMTTPEASLRCFFAHVCACAFLWNCWKEKKRVKDK